MPPATANNMITNTNTSTKTSFPSFTVQPCVKIAVLADQPTDEMGNLEREDGISDETLVSVIPLVVHEKVLLRLSSDVAYSLQELLEESDDFGELRYGYEMVLDPQQLMKKKIQTLNDHVHKRHV